MANDDFNINSFKKTENEDAFDLTKMFSEEEDFKISPQYDEDEDIPFAVAGSDDDSKGELDDTNLSDDFVIGQDFFIDSAAADEVASENDQENGKKKSKKKRKKKASAGSGCLVAVVWMAAILVISIAAASTILYFGKDYLGFDLDPGSDEENIEIVIPEGTSAKEIAEMLEEKGVIDSPLFFRFYASRSGYAAKFRDGIYYFSKQDSYEDIAEKLTQQGTQALQVTVTIPEGWNIDQIAERLEKNKVCTAAQFKKAVNEASYDKYQFDFMNGIKDQSQGVHYRLEGYLYPDTYFFYQTNDEAGAEQAIRKMLQNFDNKITPSMRIRAEELKIPLHDIITMASIIELEAGSGTYEEKQKVASVFWNRINNWGDQAFLQSDPTSAYKYNKDRYDTYKAVGLAPGAYCSPSVQSINAALYPTEKSEYYFFVTDKNMKFYFNKTNSEHNKTISSLKKQGLWLETKR